MEKKKISLKEIGLPRLIMLFAVGILFILISFPNIFSKSEPKKSTVTGNDVKMQQNDMNTTSYSSNTYVTEMENKLERILRKVNGIGEVEVALTLKTSKEQVPLKDSPYTQEGLNEVDGEGGSRTDNNIKRDESTVMVTGEDGNTTPYIVKEREPEIEGVIVIAEGGDNVLIISDIVEAAEVLFNVPAHKVKVMKMSERTK